MSQVKDVDFAIGETWVMPFSCETADGDALSGVGGTIVWLLQDYETRATVLTATVVSGIVWTDQAGGLGLIAVTPAMQTAAGVEAGTYRHRLTLTLADGSVTDQATGDFMATQRAEIDEESESGSGGSSGS